MAGPRHSPRSIGKEEKSVKFLDEKADSPVNQLWLVDNRDGTREITDEANKNGRGGFAPAWGRTYRDVLNDMVDSLQKEPLHWLEIYAAYVKGEQMIKGPLGGASIPGVIFIASATVYTAYIGTHYKGHFLGFGGRKYKITMQDGTEYESNNVWFGRNVPPILRQILPDNATMKCME
jgi:hypothetical protein